MWCDPYDWLNKLHNVYMAAIVSIISRRGLRIEVHCRNQPNTVIVSFHYISRSFHFKAVLHLKQYCMYVLLCGP